MPSSSPPPASTWTPTSAATPTRPTSSPASRAPVSRSSGSKRSASSAAISGAVAITIAAVEDSIFVSPAEISGNGIATSTRPKIASQRQRPRSEPRPPPRRARSSRATAPSATRKLAIETGGMPPSIATLISR